MHDCEEYYGTPGVAWVKVLAEDYEELRAVLPHMVAEYTTKLAPLNAPPQILRVAHFFALLAVAGEQATLMGITGWELDDAFKAIKQCFDAWLEDFGGVAVNKEEENLLEHLRTFATAHGASRFQDFDESSPSRIINNRVGFINKDKNELWIQTDIMKSDVLKGYNFKWAIRTLVKSKVIKIGPDQDRYTQQKRIDALGGTKSNVYVIDRAVLFGTEEKGALLPANEDDEIVGF